MGDNKKVHIIGGGTVNYVRPHLALAAPAYGETARTLERLCKAHPDNSLDVVLHLTKMASAGQSPLETNEQVEKLVDEIVADMSTKIVFMNVAMADYEGTILSDEGEPGKYGTRLQTREQTHPLMGLTAARKVLNRIRMTSQGNAHPRKDIILVGFKTTCGASPEEQYIAGLRLLKETSCNLVLANDTKTRLNMVITPQESRYHETTNRLEALTGLVDMAYLRSHLTFTRSTVVSGDTVPWNSPEVPEALRTVVNYCIKGNAYKPFLGATAGHFAAKLDANTFLTSKRKKNFNQLDEVGLVKVVTDGPDRVIAYGARPSVGGQSQRIVFDEHPDVDCIVHFHCPIKEGSPVPEVSQRAFECGSHQCGQNTSRGLQRFGNLYAVYLEEHGPNIAFNRDIDPQEVIDFIEKHFDLNRKTGGYVVLPNEHD